jgi:hypothetical protein
VEIWPYIVCPRAKRRRYADDGSPVKNKYGTKRQHAQLRRAAPENSVCCCQKQPCCCREREVLLPGTAGAAAESCRAPAAIGHQLLHQKRLNIENAPQHWRSAW